ncbi:hypothetical protein [Vibrio phage vB_VhaS-a]|nr:hypothetical protein [Vibrio phage vB_VhaS-a]
MHTITAENVLGIANVAPNFAPSGLDVSFIGRAYLGENHIETLADTVARTGKDAETITREGRKAVIRTALLYHRFNDSVTKPDKFAMDYADGRYDALPDGVCELLKQYLAKAENNIDASKLQEPSKLSFIIGSVDSNHIELHRVQASPLTYRMTVHLGEDKPISLEIVSPQILKPKWLY